MSGSECFELPIKRETKNKKHCQIILGIQSDTSLVGKAYYIEGGDGWEFEDSFYNTQPQWLGEESTRRMRMNAEAVQKVRRELVSFHG